jgi:hypothetical protein
MIALYVTQAPAQAMSLIEHVRAIRCYDLGGAWLHIAEMHGNDAHLFRNHPESMNHVWPGRNGTMKDEHISDLQKGSKMQGKCKKGDSVRTALSHLFDLIGDPALDPDL